MNKQLFTDGWLFQKLPFSTDIDSQPDNWQPVDVPHDWLIWDTENLYKSDAGWYSKDFTIDASDDCISICFLGVYMDCTVFINSSEVGVWRYGYTSFEFDITRFLRKGCNNIKVQVRHMAPNTRWYSGAGIYRDVYLIRRPGVHVVSNGVYISTDNEKVNIHTEITNKTMQEYDISVSHRIADADGNIVSFSEKCSDGELQPGCSAVDKQILSVSNPTQWSLENTYRYKVLTTVSCNGEIIEELENEFGFRTLRYDVNEGFFLNGKYLKLHGVCMHHDLGALGSAINEYALERQLVIMKDMGVNAIRTSHNPPTPQLLDICDRIGLLVMDELLDMWKESKTENDYHRFFNECCKQDCESWITRDRNHPCVILWSIGNEIHDTHVDENGLETAKMLRDYVKEFDYMGNAPATIASNYMDWIHAQNVAKELGIGGYNYAERLYDKQHEMYPDMFIYGSETSSAVRTRGVYHFPAEQPVLLHDDHQCSSLSNSVVSWGRSCYTTWIMDRDRKFCGGQFIWTGFDYIGEPTPYSTKNSYFGIVDTAGFSKDVYYFYQSSWTDAATSPMLHLFPRWDWNDGQLIDVIAYSNLNDVELFLNGKSLGHRYVDHINGTELAFMWKVPFEKGTIKAVAYDSDGNAVLTQTKHTPSDPVRINVTPSKTVLSADGCDICFCEITVTDKDGYEVENALNRINVKVSGAARLTGLDNGDSTDYEQYKCSSRKLFNGKLLAMIQCGTEAGEITAEFTSTGLEKAVISLKSISSDKLIALSSVQLCPECLSLNDVPIRKIELECSESRTLTKEHTSLSIKARLLPLNTTFSDIECKILSDNGTPSVCADVINTDGVITVTARSNGKCRLCVSANNGGEYPQVLSELELDVVGVGAEYINPYEMVKADTYNYCSMPINIIAQNSVRGFDEPYVVGYRSVDFGDVTTDEIILYSGNSNGRACNISIWDGVPEEGGEKIGDYVKETDGRWNSFTPHTYKLDKPLSGVHDLCIYIDLNIIFGGFCAVKKEKAYTTIPAAEYAELYGDDYAIDGKRINGIGNNVTIVYDKLDFGDTGADSITVCGRTANKVNTIQLRYIENDETIIQLLEFNQCSDYTAQQFSLPVMKDKKDVSFVFLPGSSFDFDWFRFESSEK